ncbi:MAG: response regulator transcription factor, partial [Thermodesulfobacteriota bacterium]|nr:response regulator transcription factor [Thermodesulfobacteriota bacterium]
MPKILIADDHAVVRKGLRKILTESDAGISVDEAGNGQEALARVLRERYELVLLDISMPGRGGLEVLKEIKSHCPGLPVMILSMHPEEEYAVRAFRAGASGYVTKDSASEELAAAVRKVLAGGRYVSAFLAENLARDLGSKDDRLPHETLSDREYQVLRMIASGRTVSEIARELSLSVKTISTYRSRILEKMRAKN